MYMYTSKPLNLFVSRPIHSTYMYIYRSTCRYFLIHVHVLSYLENDFEFSEFLSYVGCSYCL